MQKCKVIANQKGGVAKTTTTINLGAGLMRSGKRVLLIDFDPQGDLTTALGFNENNTKVTIKNLLEKNLVSANKREYVLSRYIKKVRDDYDYILIDCQPSLGLLTINALAASDSVIIPVQAQYLPLKGMTQLLQTIKKVRAVINSKLKIEGVVITLADMQTRLAKATEETLRSSYGSMLKIFKSIIPIATKVAEATTEGKSIYGYDKSNKASIAYENFSKEVLENGERFKNRDTKCR